MIPGGAILHREGDGIKSGGELMLLACDLSGRIST
jgi:hypothetical protein